MAHDTRTRPTDWQALAERPAVELARDAARRDVQAARFHPQQEKPQLRYAGRLALGLNIDG